jgi:succinyl-CoA:acetate CoA-transferase
MSSDYENRILNKSLLKKVISAEMAADMIKDGMNVAASGFTPSGYPKAVPLALAKKVQDTGEKLKINLFTGASVGDELDGALARAGVIAWRWPYQTNKFVREAINKAEIKYVDTHLSHCSQQVRYGFFGNIDIAIVEAVSITEEGNIIPSTSVGNTPTFVKMAKKVIIEVNTSQPLDLIGIHDIYIPQDPPNRKPIPLTMADQRIGTPYIECNPDKIAGIVITDIKDNVRPLAAIDDISAQMAGHLIDFLDNEVKRKRLPENLLPLQSGVGSVANAVLGGLLNSKFTNLDFFSEVIQDSVFDLIDADKIRIASGTSITPSEQGLERLYKNIKHYKEKLILRSQEISNNPELARRLGSIAMNTAIETDIYGNVNSTHVMGTSMMNGIGGSGDFARNAYLTIFTTQSIAKSGKISCIVPMVSHTDHTEHDVDLIVTEQGIADLRGLAPSDRAKAIIENCAHPDYKPMLLDYYNESLKANGKHTPHILKEALSWHIRFVETGSMKPKGF